MWVVQYGVLVGYKVCHSPRDLQSANFWRKLLVWNMLISTPRGPRDSTCHSSVKEIQIKRDFCESKMTLFKCSSTICSIVSPQMTGSQTYTDLHHHDTRVCRKGNWSTTKDIVHFPVLGSSESSGFATSAFDGFGPWDSMFLYTASPDLSAPKPPRAALVSSFAYEI